VSTDPFVWAVPWLGFVVHTETWFALAGVAVGMATSRVAARRRGVIAPSYTDLAGVVFWGVVIGRLWYAADHLQFFTSYPLALFSVVDGGLTAPGMLLGALWGVREVARATGLTWRVLTVLAAPALAAARTIQLAGCAVTHCAIGLPTNLTWAHLPDPAQHPVALYGVLLLAAAWFITSRASTGRISAWVPIVVYVAAELTTQAVAVVFSVWTA
jgi:prolipoprotein diacylglyceryl transferase